MGMYSILSSSRAREARPRNAPCPLFAAYSTPLHRSPLQAVAGATFQLANSEVNAQHPIDGWESGLRMVSGIASKHTSSVQPSWQMQLTGIEPVSMVLFPPGKGEGDDVAYGFKGKGVTIHCLVDGEGMPLAFRSTAANAYEPAQVIPLLESIDVQTGQPGCPLKNPALLQGDAGYDSKILRKKLKFRGIQPRISVNPRQRKKPKMGRPYTKTIDRWKCERTFSWCQRKFRRLVVRWERQNIYWHGFFAFGFCLMWIDRLVG